MQCGGPAVELVGAVEALEDAVADDAPLLLDAHVVRAEVEPTKEGGVTLTQMHGKDPRDPKATKR